MNAIFNNKILFVTLTVWTVTQGIKVLLKVIRNRKLNFKWFIGTGGMPSSHAAGATTLATSCGIERGFGSVEFALAAIFALVTMFDAQGVRRSAGQQAVILNKVMDDVHFKGKVEVERIREFFGHTPLQVIIGGFLGIFMSYFFYHQF